MLRKVSFAPDEWYHCYNRGVDKRIIYKNAVDYRRFQMLLYGCNSTERIVLSDFRKKSGGPSLEFLIETQDRKRLLVDIGAYALMPNHYHLLLREREPGGISLFMRKLCTGYAMSFNLRYERTGVLFAGRFKARHVSEDRYMRRVVNYIHANPAELFEHNFKEGKIRNLSALQREMFTYPYSSYRDYQLGEERHEAALLSRDQLRDATDVDLGFGRIMQDAMDFRKL